MALQHPDPPIYTSDWFSDGVLARLNGYTTATKGDAIMIVGRNNVIQGVRLAGTSGEVPMFLRDTSVGFGDLAEEEEPASVASNILTLGG